MIQAILIDVDNTLLDFDACVKASLRDGFAHFGLPAYQEEMFPVFNRINNELWHRIELGTLTREELMKIRFNRIFQELGIDFDGVLFESYFRAYLFESAIHVEGALELLQYLSSRYVVCAASNGPYEQQIHRLKNGGMAPYITHSFISEQAGAEKPSKEFFDVCLETLRKEMPGIQPQEVMMIGDSLTADMSGGIAYGLPTCWYNPDHKARPDTIEVDYEVFALKEIQAIL